MTEISTSPAAVRRSLWRRPWIWVVSAAILVAVVIVVVIGVVMSTVNSSTGENTPGALLARVIERTNQTVVAAGGTWTFEDASPWTPGDTSGYTGVPCGNSDAGPAQYPVQLNSAGVADPAASAARVAKKWSELGYRVRTVVPAQADNADFTEIAADFSDGAKVVYSVSTKTSGIDAVSECSPDPTMLDTTK